MKRGRVLLLIDRYVCMYVTVISYYHCFTPVGAFVAAVGPVVMAAPAFWLAAAAAAAAAATCLMLRQLHSGFVTPSVHRALDHMVVVLQLLVSPFPATLRRF